jgi:polysaccharide biosynthesis protein PslH
MRIVFVTEGLPYPPHSGARLRDYHLIRQASRQHRVTVLSQLETAQEAQHVPQLRSLCERVETVLPPPHRPVATAWHATRWGLAGRPLAAFPFIHAAMIAKLRAIIAAGDTDIIQIEHSWLAPYVEYLPRSFRGRTVLDLHNIGERQYQSMTRMKVSVGRAASFWLKRGLMHGWEARYAARFDQVMAVSEVDAAWLRRANHQLRVTVIENGVDTGQLRPLGPPLTAPTLLFVGTMGYLPNVDAVLHLHDVILPLIRREYPQVKLLVVGRAPRPEIVRLSATPETGASDPLSPWERARLRVFGAAHVAKTLTPPLSQGERGQDQDQVIVTGEVADVTPYYEQAQVCVVPLRAGGGTRLKILEAMALGRPVVSSSLGCEGLAVTHDEHLLIAEAPDDFAAAVVRLLRDPSLWHRLTQNARRLVETRYDWAMIGDKLLDLYAL